MRSSVVSGFAVLATTLVLAPAAGAAEIYAKGMAVAREYRTEHGHRFLLTVTPPADRAVDPRIFDVIDISSSGDLGSSKSYAAPAKVLSDSAAAQSADDTDLVDVSDMHLRLELLSTAACTIQGSLKYKKVNLNGHRQTSVDFVGAGGGIVVVYPTKGDVDAEIDGPDGAICDVSLRLAGQMDVAACNNCSASATFMTGIIENLLSAQASYVGGFIFVLQN